MNACMQVNVNRLPGRLSSITQHFCKAGPRLHCPCKCLIGRASKNASISDCLECRCASIDGDADRLVYFSQQGSTFSLLDGDKIAALLALVIQKLLAASGQSGVQVRLDDHAVVVTPPCWPCTSSACSKACIRTRLIMA